MTSLPQDGFERAWRAFVADDAADGPSAALEDRVRAAVRHPRRRRSRTQLRITVALFAVAASIALLIPAIFSVPRRADPPVDRNAGRHDGFAPALQQGAVVLPPTSPGPKPPKHETLRPEAPQFGTPPPVAVVASAPEPPFDTVVLAADPVFASETLQLVRVRLPRSALRSFGVGLIDPDAGGFVELDVLLGGDGLPRSLHAVRAIQE